MPVNAIKNTNTMRLTVTAAPALIVNLDMSLARHAYSWLEDAQAKPMNSILHAIITANDILQDLRSLGSQLEQKMLAPTTPKISLAAQLALTRQVMNAGNGVNAATQRINAVGTQQGGYTLPMLHGDYTVASGRTYRVDNVAMNPTQAPNHCYPIAGPNLWANVSQATFAAAAAVCRLQNAMVTVRDDLPKKWKSLSSMPPSERVNNALFNAISGARTHFNGLPGGDKSILGVVSGQSNLLRSLASLT